MLQKLRTIKFLSLCVIVLGTLATIIEVQHIQSIPLHAQTIDYYSIGVGVTGPSSAEGAPIQQRVSVPPGCYPIVCTIACPNTNPNCCPLRYVCPSGVPSGIPTPPSCIPRPPCLDGTPRCLIAEPEQGWCPSQTVTPTPTAPQGCYYRPGICPMIACRAGGFCPPCRPILVCPSLTPSAPLTCFPRPGCLDVLPRCEIAEPKGGWCPPTPTPMVSSIPVATPTCFPRPACLDRIPKCEIPEPIGGWCPGVQPGTPVSAGSVNQLLIYLNTWLRSLFHIQ